jgi:hypothetical protein
LAEAITACAAEMWVLAAVLAEAAIVKKSMRAEASRTWSAVLPLADLEHAFAEVFPSHDDPALEP